MNKKIAIFVPFARGQEFDDEKREVTGYAFVNEVVKGEGGLRLKRSAMMDATAAYLADGTVRAMHQPIAAGKPLEVLWDEKGAMLRAYIADDNEWRKVKTGVYRGFSVGVNGMVTPGTNNVDKCEWWDTSLVDRGKDPDAKFIAFRSNDEEFTPDVIINSELSRFDSFDDMVEANQLQDDCDDSINYLWSVLWQISSSDVDNKEELASQSIDQFKAYILPKISASSIKERSEPAPVIQRVEVPVMDEEAKQVFERQISDQKTELSRVQTLLSEAEAEVKRLRNEPAPVQKPVMFGDIAGLERTFTANQQQQNNQLAAAEAELQAILSTPVPVADAAQMQRAIDVRVLERQIKFLKGQ